MYISINIDAIYQHITIVEQELKYAKLLLEQLRELNRTSGAMNETDRRLCLEALRKAEALEASIYEKKRTMQEMADRMRYVQKKNQEDIDKVRAFIEQQLP